MTKHAEVAGIVFMVTVAIIFGYLVSQTYINPGLRCHERGYMTSERYQGHTYCSNPIPAPKPDAVRID